MRQVDSIGRTLGDSDDDLLIVTSSFERERSVAASRRLSQYGARCTVLITSGGDSSSRGERQKKGSVLELLELLAKVDAGGFPRQILTTGFDPVDLIRQINDELRGRSITPNGLVVTLDISCLTKLQLVTLLRFFIGKRVASRLRLIYTYPEAYNTGGWERVGRLTLEYSRPLIFPIQGAFLEDRRVRRRMAIVVVGHEGPRTLAAWRYAGADDTWLIEAWSKRRQVMDICRGENRFLYESVLNFGEPSKVISVPNTGLVDTCRTMQRALDGALSDQGVTEVSVVPFGPKPVLAGLCLALLSRPRMSAELVYSICKRYNAEYSTGVEGVYSEEIVV